MSPSEKRFPEVKSEIDFPAAEEKILAFWKENRIFEKTFEARRGSPKGTFVFYEGPPTANGVPHNGHVLTRVMKDLFPRYRTMRGYYVPRKAGWDTHGLPVEVEVEKELRIHGKAAIEEYGIEPFTAKCIESVFRYTAEWERNTDRIGFWVDLADAYVTFHRSYVESVWWALSDLFKKGLLYRGHKVVWWWAQGGTALSSAEVGLGYKTVDDPSVYVTLPLRDGPRRALLADEKDHALLVWTTTPWTLPSNTYAAVHPEHEYVFATVGDRKLVLAAALLPELAKKLKVTPEISRTVKGKDLLGLSYTPPFTVFERDYATVADEVPYWTVVSADFVTLDSGTGIVHIAPAFGDDDFKTHQKLFRDAKMDPPAPFSAVKPDGTFIPEMGKYAGMWVKAADRELVLELKERGLLVLAEQYRHDYPFCWRSDEDPLIQLARPAWYIRTTEKIETAIANNRSIDWHPEHIKEGRFGDFLRNNVDWALSRERYWGTPLPIWKNDELPDDHPEHYVAVSSLAELASQKGVNLAEVEKELAAHIPDPKRAHHLLVHKPWIDRVTFTRDGVPGTYRRVTEVVDVWFDSGCMPFAQWGFPHAEGSLEKFREAFPADFISEAIDQTRGWFYSLLMVSTLVFDEAKQKELGLAAGGNHPHPYKACILLGHVCDKEGKKESKSKGNYTPPEVILDRVRMEFAVVDDAAVGEGGVKSGKAARGVALIAREDLEGLDLADGAKVLVYRADLGKERGVPLELRALKGLKRRVVLLADEDRHALEAVVAPKGLSVRPVEVPTLPSVERVFIEDPTTPAPGADAFRWFFYAASPPWTNTRHSLSNVRALQKDFLIKLRNVFSFFTIYANIDGFHPGMTAPSPGERPLLDRWILSELALTVREVTAHLDVYSSYEASQRLMAFVESLSNWYVRRSRERFWAPGAGEAMSAEKRSAYATLHTCLVEVSLLSAPFVPFFSEELYQSLVVGAGDASARASVHLEDYPVADEGAIDEALSTEMGAIRELVSLGLQVRTGSKLKVRQPLRQVDVVLSRPELRPRIEPYAGLLREELNVHEVRFLAPGSEGEAVRYRVKPNFRVLGPKVGKKVQRVKQLLETVDPGPLRARLVLDGEVPLDVDGEVITLSTEDLDIVVEAAEGFAAAGGRAGVVVLHTKLDDALLDEGLAREIQSRLSTMRKEAELGFTDRVVVAVDGSDRVRRVVEAARAEIAANVLAERIEVGAPTFTPRRAFEGTIDGEATTISLARA
jgi:isoleucyl-tRNA synthetase